MYVFLSVNVLAVFENNQYNIPPFPAFLKGLLRPSVLYDRKGPVVNLQFSFPKSRRLQQNSKQCNNNSDEINPSKETIDNHGCHSPFFSHGVCFFLFKDVICQNSHVRLFSASVFTQFHCNESKRENKALPLNYRPDHSCQKKIFKQKRPVAHQGLLSYLSLSRLLAASLLIYAASPLSFACSNCSNRQAIQASVTLWREHSFKRTSGEHDSLEPRP